MIGPEARLKVPKILRKLLIALVLFLALLLPASALLLWSLAGTESGTRWLAQQARGIAGETLTWRQLDGTLLGTLRLQGLQVNQPGTSIAVDSLALTWRPQRLAAMTLQIDRLALAGVRVALAPADTGEPPGEPFDPSSLDLPLDIRLHSLSVRDLELQLGEGEPQRIDELTLAVALQAQGLHLDSLAVSAPQGGLTASGTLGLTRVMPVELVASWRWRLPDARELGGDVELSGDARELAVMHQGTAVLPLRVEGTLRDVLTTPGWDLVLDWPQLQWVGGETVVELDPGSLQTRGDLAGFSLDSHGGARVSGAPALRWRLTATGDAQHLELAPLALDSQPYQVELSGRVAWAGELAVDLAYHATGGQLADLSPDLPPRLDARGELHAVYADSILALQAFALELDQSPLRLEAEAQVNLAQAGEPRVEAKIRWRDAQWPLSGEALAGSPAGELAFQGTPSAYNLALRSEVAGTALPPGEWLAQAAGDSAGMRLQSLRGSLLAGTINASGDLGWSPQVTWNLALDGAGLNPGAWQPQLPGKLELSLATRGAIDAGGRTVAALELAQLSGELLGRPLALVARAELAGPQARLQSLRLDSGDNQLRAAGELDDQRLTLDWTLEVPEPGVVLPGAAGELSAAGNLRGTLAQPLVQAQLQGQDLAYAGQQLAALAASLQAGLGADDPLQLDVTLNGLRQEEVPLLDTARLAVSGTTARQRLSLDVETPTERVHGELAGDLDLAQSTWAGTLSELALGSESLGAWRLDGDAPLALAASSASLGQTCLLRIGTGKDGIQPLAAEALPGTRICVDGGWGQGEGSRGSATLTDLSLVSLLPALTGAVEGRVQGALAADGALQAEARFTVSPGELTVDYPEGSRSLAHGGGALDATVDADGLEAVLALAPLQEGRIEARVPAPNLNRLPLGQPQALAGEIHADLPDLSGLQGWVPQLQQVAGRLDADLRLAGTLDAPQLLGELALNDAVADVPAAGLQLRDIRLSLRDDPARSGQLRLTGGLRSGEGRLALDGQIDPAVGAVELALKGERVEVFNTPDARVMLSPALALDWADELLTVRGRLEIPRARITPQLGLRPGQAAAADAQPPADEGPGPVILPSSDVVVLGVEDPEGPAPAVLPFRLDSRVQLALGDDVRVNALGFDGGITGAVTFVNQPEDLALLPTARGRFSIAGGTFRAFGQDLEIETGEVIFSDAPVTEPEVNLRAVRWIDSDPLVSAAGVLVTGPATAPTLELFSRPQLEPTEIQSYLLTGSSSSGEESVLGFGTYVHPKLYVGYGFNLLEETSEFDALYTITPRYGVEAAVGEADNSVGVTFTYER